MRITSISYKSKVPGIAGQLKILTIALSPYFIYLIASSKGLINQPLPTIHLVAVCYDPERNSPS